ncbi:MAG TPA: nitroreductase family protein [Solirubrobacteraceae bacterium]|jgi:nitroreductase|nr:nitroreductase family protein [Solirubrobacteraceae bacterium]
MELIEAMKTVGTCRSFCDEPVPDAVLWKAVDAARFGPQGGNRQPVRLIIVTDVERKLRLGELYLQEWESYTGYSQGSPERGGHLGEVDAFASAFGHHPAIVVVCAHLESLLATDAQLDRLSIVGGASVYPIVQNFMLALRDQGVASALTTLLCAREAEVQELLAIPEDYATACHVAIGYPAKPFPRHLSRRPVEELACLQSFDGPPLQSG